MHRLKSGASTMRLLATSISRRCQRDERQAGKQVMLLLLHDSTHKAVQPPRLSGNAVILLRDTASVSILSNACREGSNWVNPLPSARSSSRAVSKVNEEGRTDIWLSLMTSFVRVELRVPIESGRSTSPALAACRTLSSLRLAKILGGSFAMLL